MTEEKEEKQEDPTEQETAIPLPERDAMSIIGGPGSALPMADGGIAADPTTPDEATEKILPPPRYDI